MAAHQEAYRRREVIHHDSQFKKLIKTTMISTHGVSPAEQITVSIGLAYCSGHPDQIHDTIKQADNAL